MGEFGGIQGCGGRGDRDERAGGTGGSGISGGTWPGFVQGLWQEDAVAELILLQDVGGPEGSPRPPAVPVPPQLTPSAFAQPCPVPCPVSPPQPPALSRPLQPHPDPQNQPPQPVSPQPWPPVPKPSSPPAAPVGAVLAPGGGPAPKGWATPPAHGPRCRCAPSCPGGAPAPQALWGEKRLSPLATPGPGRGSGVWDPPHPHRGVLATHLVAVLGPSVAGWGGWGCVGGSQPGVEDTRPGGLGPPHPAPQTPTLGGWAGERCPGGAHPHPGGCQGGWGGPESRAPPCPGRAARGDWGGWVGALPHRCCQGTPIQGGWGGTQSWGSWWGSGAQAWRGGTLPLSLLGWGAPG